MTEDELRSAAAPLVGRLALATFAGSKETRLINVDHLHADKQRHGIRVLFFMADPATGKPSSPALSFGPEQFDAFVPGARTDFPPRPFTCGNCGARNVVAVCRCGKAYALTQAHVRGEQRAFDSEPLVALPPAFTPGDCDFFVAERTGGAPAAVEAGTRQRTCPSCRTEFLARHDL